MIAHNPLLRSGQAALPHPAPALGNHAEAHEGIRMRNASRWEPARYQAPQPSPRQMVALTATAQHRAPQVPHCQAKGAQRRTIHGHPVVTKVPQQDRAQVCSLFLDGRVQASPQFLFQGPQFGLPPLPPLPHRLPQHREVPLPSFPATMREPKKVERPRFAGISVSSIVFRKAAKLDDSGFVSMQLKAETHESLAQFRQKPLCFITMLESRDEIVSQADEDYLPARLLLFPLPDPEVEYSGRTQVRCWCATRSCCFRPLIGQTPVPQSVPQSVSCIPHYHPGRRDFPSPVGSEDISAWSLPGRPTVQAMVRIRGLLIGLLPASSGWLVRDAPDTVFRSALPLQTVCAQGSLAPEGVTLFHRYYEPIGRSRCLSLALRAPHL